jgi:hypothetical protein
MVLLLPQLEGEHLLTCSDPECGTVGLGSPVRARSTFYRRSGKYGVGYRSECRRCSTRRQLAHRHRRDPEVRKANQRRHSATFAKRHPERSKRLHRESAARQRAADPEGYKRRKREVQRRYLARRSAADIERRNELARMNYKLRREQEGFELKIARVAKNVTSGVVLPPEPFKEWIESLVAAAERNAAERAKDEDERKKLATSDVAAQLGVSVRRLYAYRFEADAFDEMVVDRCTSHHGGVMMWELYPEQLNYEPAQSALF